MASLLKRRTIQIGALFLLVMTFSIAAVAAESGITFVSEHMRLTAYFGEEEVRIVVSDGKEIILPQVRAASGAKYAVGTTTFWNKGDEASFEYQGAIYEMRVADPLTDPWEKAKQAGVSFRGIGQEPGWMLEIWEGDRIRLVLDYGDTEIKTPIGLLEINYLTRTRTYRTVYPMSPLRLKVTIQDRACYDPMSGEGFPATVMVEIGDGSLYAGCGRYLSDPNYGPHL